jgi:hypothetical protein
LRRQILRAGARKIGEIALFARVLQMLCHEGAGCACNYMAARARRWERARGA